MKQYVFHVLTRYGHVIPTYKLIMSYRETFHIIRDNIVIKKITSCDKLLLWHKMINDYSIINTALLLHEKSSCYSVIRLFVVITRKYIFITWKTSLFNNKPFMLWSDTEPLFFCWWSSSKIYLIWLRRYEFHLFYWIIKTTFCSHSLPFGGGNAQIRCLITADKPQRRRLVYEWRW